MKISKTIVVIILILSTFSGLNLVSFDVSADELNCTWKPTSGVLASTAANWENGSAPTTGNNIYFISSWTTNCIYDISTSVGAFNIRTGYSGTITQAASFSVTSYSQAAGTFTGSASYILTDSGDFIRTAGTITNYVLKLSMTGTDKILTITPNLYLSGLTVSGTITTTTSFRLTGLSISGTLTLGTGTTLELDKRSATVWSNTGILNGLGSFLMNFYNANWNMAILGVINCPLTLYSVGDATQNITITTAENTILSSTLNVYSLHATNTMALILNGYSLSAAGITIGTRGIITAGASTITDSGNWDSSASSNVASSLGSAKVHLTGASKTFKQSSVERISSLFFDVGSSYTLQSNVYCTNYWLNGTVTKNGYTVYVNNNQAPSITSSTVTSCHFINNYYYNVTATDQDDILTYGLTSSWPNVDINTTTGKITNVAPLANGTWLMSVSVTDGNHTIYQNFSLNIWNYAPIFITRAKYISPIYDDYFYSANATDSEGYSITFNCTFEGVWLVWNPTNHSLSGQAFEREIGYYDVSISAWDGYKTTWQNFTIKIEGPLTSMLVSFIIYFSFLLIVFGIILIGYFKIPLLLFFGIIMSIALAIPIITSFGDYAIFGIILILMNMTVSIMGLSRTKIGK